MNTNETANQTSEEITSTPPQFAEAPEKEQKTGPGAWVKPILAVMGVAALAGVAYGIGCKKTAVELPELHKEAVKQLPQKIAATTTAVQLEPEVRFVGK